MIIIFYKKYTFIIFNNYLYINNNYTPFLGRPIVLRIMCAKSDSWIKYNRRIQIDHTTQEQKEWHLLTMNQSTDLKLFVVGRTSNHTDMTNFSGCRLSYLKKMYLQHK